MAKVLAVAELRDGAIRKVSEEAVTAARTLADELEGETHVFALGASGAGEAAKSLARVGADVIHSTEHDAFAEYLPESYAATLAAHIRDAHYDAVIFAATALGKDLAPRVAARLDVPLAAEVTEFSVDAGEIVITRPIYGGRAFAHITIDATPQIISIRPNVFRAVERAGKGEARAFSAAAEGMNDRVRVRETKAASGDRLDVGEAPIVVSGGRGMKGPENWHMLEELRDALGITAALGASRAVVDAGWRPHAEQVGQTGKTVSPQLYFAVAISGAMQHLAGMRSAKTIVAINKDPDAPIFKVADYGVIGDVNEILPALSARIRETRGG
jgi:electron transfer flavoprotein alpha subunit